MELIISERNLKELVTSGESEVGYLFMFRQSGNHLYSVSKLIVPGRKVKSIPDSALDEEVMKYIFTTPDAVAVPYKDIEEGTDERTYFYSMLQVFDATKGELDLFLAIKNKDLGFYTITKEDRVRFNRVPHYVNGYDITSDNDRAREILIDSLALCSRAK